MQLRNGTSYIDDEIHVMVNRSSHSYLLVYDDYNNYYVISSEHDDLNLNFLIKDYNNEVECFCEAQKIFSDLTKGQTIRYG